MSTRRTLHVTTTDPAASLALARTQLRAAGHHVPTMRHGTTVLSARVSFKSRDAVRATAKRMGLSPSKFLGMLANQIATPGAAAPTGGGAQDILNQIGELLALPPGSRTVDSILVAIGEIGDQIAAEEGEGDVGPAAADPLAASDPPPAKLSRTFTTSRGVVTLSASELKSCEESGAKPEAYAENKAIREAARRPARAGRDPLRAVHAARREQARRR